MTITTIEVPVVAMTERAFAPYGEVFGLEGGGDKRTIASTGFTHQGQVSVATIWNPHGNLQFSKLERHYAITQGFVQLSGAPSVVCAAPATDINDAQALPRAGDVVGFLIDPGQGYLFHVGTWHALDRCVLAPPGATFMIINVKPNPTQVIDFATASSDRHTDLDVTPVPDQLPWPDVARCRFRLRL
jgi:ureidoglycolate hydrolase